MYGTAIVFKVTICTRKTKNPGAGPGSLLTKTGAGTGLGYCIIFYTRPCITFGGKIRITSKLSLLLRLSQSVKYYSRV